MLRYLILAIIAALGLAREAPAQIQGQSGAKTALQKEARSALNELKDDINSLLDNPDFSEAHIGISILSVETGEYFYKLNEAKNFIPASTQKLLTTAAALHYLGPDFRYVTQLFLDGDLRENGEYIGNIYIRGSGDPTMSEYFVKEPLKIIERWTARLDSLGVKSIRGNIIGDDDYFDDMPYAPGWAWDDFIYPFSAQIGALSFYDNVVDLIIAQGDTVGKPAQVHIFPESAFVKAISNVRTVASGGETEALPFKELASNMIYLFGTIPYDEDNPNRIYLPVTVDNPTMYFVNIFSESLSRNNIQHRGALIDVDDLSEKPSYYELVPACEYESPPTSEIIKIVNKRSHNFVAEALFKTIAKENLGEGSFRDGADMALKFAEKAGISPENVTIVDGSGLSRLNLVSPYYQTALLAYMRTSQYWEEFAASLATPGEEGTLEKRMVKTRAEKSVFAKTGSMNGVSNLAGYVLTSDGETLAVSIMMNNFSCPANAAKNLQDLICMRLSTFSRKRR